MFRTEPNTKERITEIKLDLSQRIAYCNEQIKFTKNVQIQEYQKEIKKYLTKRLNDLKEQND